MEESLKNLFAETMHLIKQYGNCLLRDPTVTPKEWKDLSSCMMLICDESLKQDVTFKRLKSFRQEIFPDLIEPGNVEDESVIFQFQTELHLTYDKLELGRSNDTYKDFEESILQKVPKKKMEHDITAVSENVNLVDPITKLPLIDPVKNSVCGHVYEKTTIMQLLDSKKSIKCPIPGCVAAAQLTKEDLVSDSNLKKHLDQE